MSLRIIQMPLSGGDRKAFARELHRVEHLHASLVKEIDVAHASADSYRRLAFRKECEEWNAQLFRGGDVAPSPVIAHALAAGVMLLEVKCNACRVSRQDQPSGCDLASKNQVHTLRASCSASAGMWRWAERCGRC